MFYNFKYKMAKENKDSLLEIKTPVGTLVDSTQADDRKMIRLVKERSLLYARNNMPVASYYSHVKRLWGEVASEMNWTVADVRRKWSHIRNSYSRHLRNEIHSARTARGRIVSRWYLADELEFLREHMATDIRASPYSTYAPSLLKMDMAEYGHNMESIDVKPLIDNPWLSLTTPRTSLCEDRPEVTCSDNDDSTTSFGPDETSSYFKFFRGIFNDYQELPPKKQRLFKRQCMNYLHDLLDEEDAHGSYHKRPTPDTRVNGAIPSETETVLVKSEVQDVFEDDDVVLPDN